ncbi:MAG: hypothetical protein PHO66_05355, partial [Eubacteriales bacterium]|nr:hypothetical protein [Eubacteriales bacterium]
MRNRRQGYSLSVFLAAPLGGAQPSARLSVIGIFCRTVGRRATVGKAILYRYFQPRRWAVRNRRPSYLQTLQRRRWAASIFPSLSFIHP